MITFNRNSRPGPARPQLRFADYTEREAIAFAASNQRATGLRPQGEHAILTHLLAAAHEAEGATLWFGGAGAGDTAVAGVLGAPDLDHRVVPFAPHAGPEVRPPAAEATVRYALGADQFRFRARVTRRPDGWWLSLPRVVEGTSQRLTPRHRADGRWRLDVRAGGPFIQARTLPVVDISAGGVGLRLVDGAGDALVDKVLTGVLAHSRGYSLPVHLAVRHVHTPDDAWDGPVVGVGFNNVGYDNIARIADVVDDDRRRSELPAEVEHTAGAGAAR